jgi:hypothetical protein
MRVGFKFKMQWFVGKQKAVSRIKGKVRRCAESFCLCFTLVLSSELYQVARIDIPQCAV